jgi:RNA polymerase sigma factor (sigma-70 family)
MSKTINDEIILKNLLGNEAERQKALEAFFQNPLLWQRTQKYVQSHHGSLQDAEDVFTEAYIIFDRSVRNGFFKKESSLSTYFQGIVKQHWFNQQKKQSNHSNIPLDNHVLESNFDLEDKSNENPENLYISQEKKVILRGLLEQIGERCKKILNFYQLNYSMDEIAEAMAFENAKVASKEALKCRKKLKTLLETQHENLQILKSNND